jgi:hypothetical protein
VYSTHILDKHEDGGIPIMPRGNHSYHFQFKLPESALPSSFESKIGTIRYYIRMTMDIPYSSSPQGIKYFTIVGPHIDCMDDKYLVIRIYTVRQKLSTTWLILYTKKISFRSQTQMLKSTRGTLHTLSYTHK